MIRGAHFGGDASGAGDCHRHGDDQPDRSAPKVDRSHSVAQLPIPVGPVLCQKMLRFQEARRLLVASADAARAAHMVGYESASQSSREYARMFGAPPGRDAERLRGRSASEVSEAA